MTHSSTIPQTGKRRTTPAWLAKACTDLLPYWPDNTFDPQCGDGALLRVSQSQMRFGVESDTRLVKQIQEETSEARAGKLGYGIRVARGDCVSFMDFFTEAQKGRTPKMFSCIVANPPSGETWKASDGGSIESTKWTWHMIGRHLANLGVGFLMGDAAILEAMSAHTHPWVYLYNRMPASGVWDGAEFDLGIIHFQRVRDLTRLAFEWDRAPTDAELASPDALRHAKRMSHMRPTYGSPLVEFERAGEIMEDERRQTARWNISLRPDGIMQTYLSMREKFCRLSGLDCERLTRINNCHPLTLTTDRETRQLLQDVLDVGVYTIEPAAERAIRSALDEIATVSSPIMPVTDFELVAYADEEESLKCVAKPPDGFWFTPGHSYRVTTGTYNFKEKYTRKKVHFNPDTGVTSINEHDCELTGADRYLGVTDDAGNRLRFQDRVDGVVHTHPESLLWEIFERPAVATIAEVNPALAEKNLRMMAVHERISGFKYFPGQLEYIKRVACKDAALIAASVGVGKTLIALTMVTLKSPRRTLIIAPQGTMRSSGEEGEQDYQASQWVQEIQRFAPSEPVFQLFNTQDWAAILASNRGTLPDGIYITYPQAYFSNGAFESIPESWENEEEKRFCTRYALPFDADGIPIGYADGIGVSKNGIRCIAEPSLHTQLVTKHGDAVWGMGIIDESHLAQRIDSCISRNILRWQPRFRYALSATPIPNVITDIFPIMGWLCVKDWYMGDRRTAAWPYTVDEVGRFNSTFLAVETDVTVQFQARMKNKPGWKKMGVRPSPVISSPARLLKLLKPTLAYISKESCNPKLVPCEVIDVRVAMGEEQQRLYSYWLDRANYVEEYKSALTIAQVQVSRLRGICASPASLDYTRKLCRSNFNPKLSMILELIRECFLKGEQVVCVSARVEQSTAIARRLEEAGIPFARIDSTLAPEDHTAEANRFKAGVARVMLMGIKCAQGHSFHKCPNLIVGSLEWTYGSLHQAQGRVWRLNSIYPVKVWVVLHKNSIEELLFDRVAVKQDAATLCLHGKRIPRDYKALDPSEVLAEHIVSYHHEGELLSESDCEMQWPELRHRLALSNLNTA